MIVTNMFHFEKNLEDEDNSYDNIDFNGYKLYVNGTAIN